MPLGDAAGAAAGVADGVADAVADVVAAVGLALQLVPACLGLAWKGCCDESEQGKGWQSGIEHGGMRWDSTSAGGSCRYGMVW